MTVPTIMLQLMAGCWVNALDISLVVSDFPCNVVRVKLRCGDEVRVAPRPREAVSSCEERIIEQINHAALVYIRKAPQSEPNFKPSGT